eukprot:9491232-Pyramimonas_sp.AAC.1
MGTLVLPTSQCIRTRPGRMRDRALKGASSFPTCLESRSHTRPPAPLYTSPDRPLYVGLGICMDINPYEFKAPFSAFEFANFHREQGTQLILFSSAWCNSHPDDTLDRKRTPPDMMETLNYWLNRLRPLIGAHRNNIDRLLCHDPMQLERCFGQS